MVLSISSVFPVTGRLNEATNITILGEDFGAGISVTVGGESVSNLLVVSPERLTCTVSNALEEDVHDIRVSNAMEIADLENAFVVVFSFPEYPFTDQTFQVIQTRMLNRLPATYEKFEGSSFYDVFSPVSLELQEIYLSLVTSLDLGSLLRSTGSYLEFKGIDLGILKRKSTQAVGEVTFIGTSAIDIRRGFEISNTPADNDESPIIFTTNEAITLAVMGTDYIGTVNVTAVENGKAGNLGIGTINNIVSPLLGLTSVTNAAATGSGSDRESELTFRSRMLAQVLTPPRAGNVENYKQWAREASIYVGKVGVDPLRKDENSGIAMPGTVGVYFLNVDGTAPDSSLIAIVQNYIGPDNEGRGRAPIGANVLVRAPNFIDIHVRVDISPSAGFIAQSVITEVEDVIENYINELEIGANLLYHTLGSRIIATNGVDSISAYYISVANTTPGNTEVNDIIINNTQKSRDGTITVT